jgi:hypothetical protein
VFTDELLPRRIDDIKPLAATVAPGTLVHAVALGFGELVRDDDAWLAELALATRGIAVRGGVDAGIDATILVRPTSLDHVVIDTRGWMTDDVELVDVRAGRALVQWIRGTREAPAALAVTGSLWGRTIMRYVHLDATRALQLTRALVMEEQVDDVDRSIVERAARAVDGAWSLYTAWGGRGGHADEHGEGGWGFGRTARVPSVRIGHPINRKSGRVDVAEPIRRATARCARGDAHVDISIETTFDEIVDVDVDVRPPSRALHDCIEDAVWDTELVVPVPTARGYAHVTL